MIFREINTIFIHIAKAGGTTITHDILKSIRGRKVKDIVAVYADPDIVGTDRSVNKAHAPAWQVKEFMGEEYNDFYKFAILRDPFEQISSLFSQLSYMNVKINPRFLTYKTMTFEEFVLGDDKFSMVGGRQRELIDQFGMVSAKPTACKSIIVDDLFPYAHYRSAIKILKKKGVPVIGKARFRSTQRKNLYSPRMINRVMDVYGNSYDLYTKVKKEFEEKYIK